MDEEQAKPFSWRRFEFAGVTAIATTIVCLLIGQSAQQFAAQIAGSPAESARAQMRFNAIDYATTGSTKGGTVIIGPCDTH